MVFNEGELRAGMKHEGEVEYKISPGSRERNEDASMIPTSSHGQDQYGGGNDRELGDPARSAGLAERLCDLKDMIRELSE